MKLFSQGNLRDYLSSVLNNLDQEVYSEDKNKLLNVNEVEYVKYLVSKYSIEPIVLHCSDKYVSDREEHFTRSSGRKYILQIITYHIPYSGTTHLFNLLPSNFIAWSPIVIINTNIISFDIRSLGDDPNNIKQAAETFMRDLRTQVKGIEKDVIDHNLKIEKKSAEIVKARKSQLLKQANLLDNLDVPIKKRKEVPSSFTVPFQKKKTIIEKPTAPNTDYQPDYHLKESTFKEILKICHEFGVEIERHPTLYQGKDEESLRDYFLMVLSPHFESVTGETFNKSGKTDILIRHEGLNAFVAECKFWKGKEAHNKTINQILSYLTWRDSKATILYFVKNKKLDPVLIQIEMETQKHNCFIKYNGKSKESWFNYHFHLLYDNTRGVSLSILCFHFPN